MSNLQRQPTRIAIIGTGNVGATFGYAIVTSGLASEIVLIDANKERAEGEAMDLNHAVPLHQPCRIFAGEYADCAGAAVVVVTAGSAQKPARCGGLYLSDKAPGAPRAEFTDLEFDE